MHMAASGIVWHLHGEVHYGARKSTNTARAIRKIFQRSHALVLVELNEITGRMHANASCVAIDDLQPNGGRNHPGKCARSFADS
eukprot:scaffold49382_cov28-Tisochrysis_lutea.AAC.3